jgi:ATP-dependent RNA helicase DDX24/MAK5
MAVTPSSVLRGAKSSKNKNKKSKAKSKGKGSSQSTSEKKYRTVPATQLPWKASRDANYDFDDFKSGEGGMLELEEIDGVDVVWQEAPDGSKTVKFNVSNSKAELWKLQKKAAINLFDAELLHVGI